jgi:hypothetical protein
MQDIIGKRANQQEKQKSKSAIEQESKSAS